MFEKVAGIIKAHPRASKVVAIVTGALLAVGITALVVTRYDDNGMLIEGTVVDTPFIPDQNPQ